jgi:SAM-dependent methyltransferase
MPARLYEGDPLTPSERSAYEEDLISLCDRELDLLGDIEGLTVLYAGGSSPLWLEGLSQRIGRNGTLTALDADTRRLEEARELLREADLAAPVRLLAGDIFRPPLPPDAFDLAYSAGLFHELDVSTESAADALAALASVVRPGGRVATSDFVNPVPATQLEDEEIQAEWTREAFGREFYGIGPPKRLSALHQSVLADVRWQISPPHPFRHLDKVILAEDEPLGFVLLPDAAKERLRARREALRDRIRREGYTRPATLYVEGSVAGG